MEFKIAVFRPLSTPTVAVYGHQGYQIQILEISTFLSKIRSFLFEITEPFDGFFLKEESNVGPHQNLSLLQNKLMKMFLTT